MDGAELMRKVVAGFAKSDLQPLLDAIHEEIVWKSTTRGGGRSAMDGEYKHRAGGSRDILSKIQWTTRSII